MVEHLYSCDSNFMIKCNDYALSVIQILFVEQSHYLMLIVQYNIKLVITISLLNPSVDFYIPSIDNV